MTPTTDQKPDAPTPPTTTMEVAKQTRATLDIIRVLAEHPDQKDLLQQLIDAETARDIFDQDYRSARVYAMSGQFDDIKGATAEQAIATAMAKIRIGRSWGMNESDSIANIYFTNGRPAVMTEILATKIQQAGYGWDIEWDWTDDTHKGKTYKRCTGCTLYLKVFDRQTGHWSPVVDRNGEPVSAWFREADADRAMIWEKGKQIPLSEKWNFRAWSQDMYFWRALSRLRKYHLTAVMRGAVQYELRNEFTVEAPPLALPEPEAEQTPPAPPRSLRDRVLDARAQEAEAQQREPGEGE